MALGVIPARANSSRFPNKIIAPILGKPMIQYVWEAARRAESLSEVVVATDSEEIAAVVKGFGGNVVMTPSDLPSGTDRVAFVAKDLLAKDRPHDLVLNLQGDEPLLEPDFIDSLVADLRAHPTCSLATLVVQKRSPEEANNQNVVKAAVSSRGDALYFSRQPLFVSPDGAFFKHIGIYGFRRSALLTFCSLPPSLLEKAERLEQLRALENGMSIRAVRVERDTIAVDTPGDIARVEKVLTMKKGQNEN